MNEVTGAVYAGELRKSYRSRAGGSRAADEGSVVEGGSAASGSRASGQDRPRGEVRALDGLSFSVAPGSVFALLGPNGAGKTTAMRILTTLSRPDTGQAFVAGIDVLRRPGRVRSVIGAVSQHSGAVTLLTGRENLLLQGRIYGIPARELRRRIAGLLDQFGLAEAADRPVRTYSGGMQRRLDVATALVHRPAVLFLDEPTTGLDPEGRAELWAVLTGLRAEAGTTILVTTHYLDEADKFAARIAIVDRGRVVAEGTSDQLKAGLEGDSVLLELGDAGQVERAEKTLARIPQVRQTSSEGAMVRARVADGPRALPAVLGGLEADDIAVLSVTVARPSLDDVYLHHAGRSFRQAEGSVAA
jgi:ABC-2 type transport system ATP-binding protein